MNEEVIELLKEIRDLLKASAPQGELGAAKPSLGVVSIQGLYNNEPITIACDSIGRVRTTTS